jgi:hypothetical protein
MKLFAGLTVWALPLAAILSFAFGGLWYGILSQRWMAAAGLDEAKIKADGASAWPFVVTFLCQLLMAWMLAGLVLHLAKAGIPATWRNGMITGFFIWAGFVMPSLVVNYTFQMQKQSLKLIDGAHWLGALLIQGAVIGLWGLAR